MSDVSPPTGAGGRVVGVVLAAGASRRTGAPKSLACYQGKPLLAHAVDTLQHGGCAGVCVVVAPPHAARIRMHLAEPRGLVWVRHTAPHTGMLGSLQVGLRAAVGEAASAVIVALVDHPRVRPATVAQVIEAWRRAIASHAPGARPPMRVVPAWRGRGGHPYLLDVGLAPAVWRATPGASPRAVFREHATLRVEVDDPGVVEDLDTPEALASIGAVLAPDGSIREPPGVPS